MVNFRTVARAVTILVALHLLYSERKNLEKIHNIDATINNNQSPSICQVLIVINTFRSLGIAVLSNKEVRTECERIVGMFKGPELSIIGNILFEDLIFDYGVSQTIVPYITNLSKDIKGSDVTILWFELRPVVLLYRTINSKKLLLTKYRRNPT